MTVCRVSKSRSERLEREFTELHEGLPPDKVSCEEYRGPASPIRREGQVVQIDYDKLIPYGKQWYYHPIDENSQPTLAFDRNGLPVVYGGRIHVTTHGIEDLDSSRQRREFIPKKPRSLSLFGRLRQIRYKPKSASRIQTWKPTRFLALAHDEQGTLHIIPERILHEGNQMARRSYRKHARRRNPPQSMVATAGQVVGVGLGTAFVAGIADYYLAPRFGGYKLAAADVGVGIAAALLAKSLGAKSAVVAVAGVGPVAVGGLRGYEEYQRQKTLAPKSSVGNGTGTLAPGSAPGPNAANRVLMPGGMPANYYPVSRQSCAVPR